jgi:hypothetical protein
MNSHIRTLVVTIVDLILLSIFILSSFYFVNHVVKCVFICFLVPSHVASLPSTKTIMAKTQSSMDGIFNFDFSHSHNYCYCCYCCSVLHYHLPFLIVSSNMLSSSPFCAIAYCLNLKLKSSWLRHEAAHWVASSPLLSSWTYNPFPYPLSFKPISYPILIIVLFLLL